LRRGGHADSAVFAFNSPLLLQSTEQLFPRIDAKKIVLSYARGPLTASRKPVNCIFAMATAPNPIEDILRDFQFPQREAAFFYGLFLRGHSPDELRRDIEVPAAVLAKWDKETAREPQLRELLERMILYRRLVLAIFENLIGHDSIPQRVQ
jgi:hypothetical protein